MYSLTFRVRATTPAVWTKWNRLRRYLQGGAASLAPPCR